MQTYHPLVSPEIHAPLAVILLLLGFAVASWFYIYEFRTAKESKSLLLEVGVATAGALLLGTGSFFLMLSCGLYI